MWGERTGTFSGVVHETSVKGPWGVILHEAGGFAWFHEETLIDGRHVARVGDRVEFDAVFHAEQDVWEAVALRLSPVQPHPEPVESVSEAVGPAAKHIADGAEPTPEPAPEDWPAPAAGETPAHPTAAEEPAAFAPDGRETVAAAEPETVRAGVVKRFNAKSGFGIVTLEDGTDIFVHRSALAGPGYRNLVEEEPVELETRFNAKKRRWEATAVRTPHYRRRGTVAWFDHDKGFGRIAPDDGGDEVFLHYTGFFGKSRSQRTAGEGELVEYEVEMADRGPKAVRVKRLDDRLPLFRFADMGDEEAWLEQLAAKAEEEPWTYGFTPNPCSKPILRSYLIYTFARLAAESEALADPDKKVQFGGAGGRRYACFNTGLVTEDQEQIFALFVENSRPADAPWRLDGFYAESEVPLLGKFNRLPELANYFDDPSVLLYDRRCELVINLPHIIRDRIDRFPKEVRDNPHVARQLLESARRQTEQRVYRNYKTAIPQFYRGAVQLLLPLCLIQPNKADLALIVTRLGNQYRGNTAITLDMAFNNARLLTRPDTDWLKP
jgi:cold shock CspA family protein